MVDLREKLAGRRPKASGIQNHRHPGGPRPTHRLVLGPGLMTVHQQRLGTLDQPAGDLVGLHRRRVTSIPEDGARAPVSLHQDHRERRATPWPDPHRTDVDPVRLEPMADPRPPGVVAQGAEELVSQKKQLPAMNGQQQRFPWRLFITSVDRTKPINSATFDFPTKLALTRVNCHINKLTSDSPANSKNVVAPA